MKTTQHTPRPDCESALRGLKDFQRDTVEYVFKRLYTDNDVTRRFLIADEVGLGKTLVARGLIARTVDYLWDSVERIDVVYICSNIDIAQQNINRLAISGQSQFALASRITLLPVELKALKSNRLNFISFTPGTSFDMKGSLGRADERALLYCLLEQAWDLGNKQGPKNVLQGWKEKVSFRGAIDELKRGGRIDPGLADDFASALQRSIALDRRERRPNLRARYDDLCEAFSYRHNQANLPNKVLLERNRFVGELRGLLAETCLKALQPDIIILDEFQRFKNLLEEGSEMSRLAHGLFNYADERSSARTILLSATPYKMYTLANESDQDDHYQDFISTVRFLQSDKARTSEFEQILDEYRREVFRMAFGQNTRLLDLKQQIEARLRKVMVRTERLAVSEDRDGMLTDKPCKTLKLESQDLGAYVGLQQVTRVLGQNDTLEYWKSAPYLLNFMDGYDLKWAVRQAVAAPERQHELADVLAANPGLLLSWQDFEAYGKIDPANARLRGLTADLMAPGAWKLLWVPPALPYYQSGGPFDNPDLAGFTKRLVFSSWRVVPKVVAALLSYEAEREIMHVYEDHPMNTPDARKRHSPLLRFAHTKGRLSGMPVFGMLYPSTTLAREVDPLKLALEIKAGTSLPTLDEIIALARSKVEEILHQCDFESDPTLQEDETWYWAAPILIDMCQDEQIRSSATRDWFKTSDLADRCSEQDDSDENSQWIKHVDEAKKLAAEAPKLGRQPKDLVELLTLMALASPGTVALRALWRVSGGLDGLVSPNTRYTAVRVAWGVRSLFNLPESMALVRGLSQDEKSPYWQKVLAYGLAGNIQSTFDEYAHFLRESLGLLDSSEDTVAGKIGEAMFKAITLRTSTLGVDDVQVGARGGSVSISDRRMRTHFAARFGADKSDQTETVNRSEQVREAFNSPFWPFVLITTSVGQEGLDFHPYCHAIVHWNLPGNPVDLEQREGRIHRYKGHAIRKNVAQRYTLDAITHSCSDPWQTLFDLATCERAVLSSDLTPFWVYPLNGGAQIERYVPALPLSRDRERMNALRRSLAAYRMVFGQNRQEDLLAYLVSRIPEQDIQQNVEMLRINLEPPHASA